MGLSKRVSIRIGGSLRRRDLNKLCDAITAAKVYLNPAMTVMTARWGAASPKTEEDLRTYVCTRTGHLSYCDPHRAYGGFDSLETSCQRLGLSYDRHSLVGGALTYMVQHRHDTGTTGTQVDDQEEPVIRCTPVIRAYKALLAGNVHAALTYLASSVDGCDEVTELPPFTIVK